MSERLVAEVLLDQNLTKPLDYEVPEEMRPLIQVGIRVEVPIRGTLKKGTIAALKTTSSWSLRPLTRVLSDASLPEPLWKLAHWMADYYVTPLQRVLKCLTPPNIRKEIKPKKQLLCALAISHEKAIDLCAKLRIESPQQALVLEKLLEVKQPEKLSSLISSLEITRSPVDTLVKKKALKWVEEALDFDPDREEFFRTPAKRLTDEQAISLQQIESSMTEGGFATHLLYGVTGSGKTEIYLQAIQKTLDLGKGALLLVPEVALTSQTIERLRSRFGMELAILHHRRSYGERTKAWEALKKGTVKLAIGARSAVFAPVKHLGLIIVDEEHDSSYKQGEEMPAYHARDVAVMRGKMEGATVILGSATPSLESFYNAKQGKYTLSSLKQRAASAKLPKTRIIDMKKARDKAGGFTHFCQELLEGIENCTQKGEQALLLLNQRGYHRLQICRECRHIAKCPHCDLSLTYHRISHQLRCHLCDHASLPLLACPACNQAASLDFRGFGTEHVERSLHAIFPSIRTLRMDRDTTQQKHSHEELFNQFRAHKADVLIGTQMIAKGFHFPSVTLVGVLNADAALQIPDVRAAEKVFQLITQVAGRAGRGNLEGEVILQTFLPDHPLLHLAAKQDYQAFFEQELEERKLFSFPPFCKLIKLIFSSPSEEKAKHLGEGIRNHLLSLSHISKTEYLPLLPCAHAKIKDLFRFQFLIKTMNLSPLLSALGSIQSQLSTQGDATLFIDVDPTSTFF